MNKTKERAKEILSFYLGKVKAFDFVRSVILVGSLSDGTYTGNPGSDIDLIHIVSDDVDYSFEKSRLPNLSIRLKARPREIFPLRKLFFN